MTLKTYRDEQFLWEVGLQFHIAGELWLKAHRPKSVDMPGNWRSCWLEERRASIVGDSTTGILHKR